MPKVILHRFRPTSAKHSAPVWLKLVRTVAPELAARLLQGRTGPVTRTLA